MPFLSKKSILGVAILSYILFNIRWAYVYSHVNNFLTPERYHGKYLTDNFFEGWYIKAVTIQRNGSVESVAMIPGIYKPPILNSGNDNDKKSTENLSGAHAFIMVIRSSYDEVLYYRYPIEDFEGDKEPSDPSHNYEISIGNSKFWNDGISLDLDPKHLSWISDEEFKEYTHRTSEEWLGFANKDSKTPILSRSDIPMLLSRFRRATESFKEKMSSTVIKADLRFTNIEVLPKTFTGRAAMGVVYWFPFVECYHNIPTMHMSVSGTFEFGIGDQLHFDPDTASGYIEKDHGYNFPVKYTWLQSNNFEQKGTTLSLSIATVPVMSPSSILYKMISSIPYVGKYFVRVVNQIGFVIKFIHPEIGLIGFDFLFSNIISLRTSLEDGHIQVLNVTVVNRYYELRVSGKRHLGSGLLIRGPKMEARDMVLLVQETMDANITVTLVRKQGNEDKIIFEGVGRAAGMEIVGDVDSFVQDNKPF